MKTMTGYIGTYASPESLGVYQFHMNPEDGSLTEPKLFLKLPDAKYVSIQDGIMAAPVLREDNAGVGLAVLAGGEVNQISEICMEEKTPCYVTQDETFIYTANYHEGAVMVYRKKDGKPEFEKRLDIAPKAGCHQVLLHDHYILVPCLLLDSIQIFDIDQEFAPVGTIEFSKGSGPRHGIFDKDHKRLYLVSELSNEVYSFAVDGLDFKLEQTISILPKGSSSKTEPSSAAVRLSPDENYLYVSTRGAELLTGYRIDHGRLTCIQQTESGGEHPRDFILTPDGRYLVAVNRYQGGLVSFERNVNDGTIGKICSRVPVHEGVSVVFDTHHK